ncbi:MAG: hypothetical protein J6X88_10755 [Bacteroidales bacterium]|nr:hypothetical protein [Bacteroidales bacterium]
MEPTITQLAIFNPEHDLCLGNGRAHYVPPRSAVDFARRAADIMSVLYPDAHCTSIYDLPRQDSSPKLGEVPEGRRSVSTSIIPWGWNLVLKQQLLDRGISPALLPSDEALAAIRHLQHRATLLPLQPDCQAISDPSQFSILNFQFSILKSPWSGAGRGLRWISGKPTPHDIAWAAKVIREQGCVIAQPRYDVADDFALLYRIEDNGLHFVGYSLFQTSAGVYRGNLLLPDPDIQARTGLTPQLKESIESWLRTNLVGHYEGPLGVDLFRTVEGDIHIAELNLRHTMGHVAHAHLRLHPEAQGTLFSPTF